MTVGRKPGACSAGRPFGMRSGATLCARHDVVMVWHRLPSGYELRPRGVTFRHPASGTVASMQVRDVRGQGRGPRRPKKLWIWLGAGVLRPIGVEPDGRREGAGG